MLEVIAPHIDDAPFSLSSLILQLDEDNCDFEITSCFSISNYHTGPELYNTEEVSLLRKHEDLDFKNSLRKDVKFNYLDLHDAPLRGYKKCTLNERFTKSDELQVDLLHQYLVSKSSNQFIVPLGLGDHIDHVISRESALQLPQGKIVAFFEDLPYAGRISTLEITAHVRLLEERIGLNIIPVVIGNKFSRYKKEICGFYKSQLKDWYIESINLQLNRHNGGECLWLVDYPDNELMTYLRS